MARRRRDSDKPEIVNPVPINRAGPEPGYSPVKLDWRAYFQQFCLTHGNWPVVDEGRLLFPDGWTYSADDYAGPEWEPPRELNELVKLQVRYWKRRRDIVVVERDKLAHDLKGLLELQKARPIPLQRQIAVPDGDGGVNIGVDEIDWTSLVGRLEWLKEDVRQCEKELHSLGEKPR